MSMRGVWCLLCVLCCLCVGVSVVVCGSPDPAAGIVVWNGMLSVPAFGSHHGLLLDVYVLPCAIDALDSITITIPQATNEKQTTNAQLTGKPFQSRLISGVSAHGGVSSRSPSLLVSWDGVSNITLSGFSLPSAVGAAVPSSGGNSSPNWVNVNWFIPDEAWTDPTTPDFKDNDITKIPLKLTPAQQGTTPHITITQDTYFQAYNKPGACTTQ